MIRLICLIVLSTALISCSSTPRYTHYDRIEEKNRIKSELVERQCRTEPMVGEESGFGLALKAKRKEIEEAKLEIGVHQYRKLSQKINNYTAQMELANTYLMQTCKENAWCRMENTYETSKKCRDTGARYSNAMDKAESLLTRLLEIQVYGQKNVNNDTEENNLGTTWK